MTHNQTDNNQVILYTMQELVQETGLPEHVVRYRIKKDRTIAPIQVHSKMFLYPADTPAKIKEGV